MTDNEVIKALECCSTATCISNKCPYEEMHDIPKCTTKLTSDALDLINRQKAEIKKLQTYITNHPYRIVIGTADIYTENHEEYEKLLARISGEAIKEFSERLQNDLGHLFLIHHPVVGELIDNLVKEMVGDK